MKHLHFWCILVKNICNILYIQIKELRSHKCRLSLADIPLKCIYLVQYFVFHVATDQFELINLAVFLNKTFNPNVHRNVLNNDKQ